MDDELHAHCNESRRSRSGPGGTWRSGGDLPAAFMRHGLIDEFRIYVHPVAIGKGKPLFQPSTVKVDLRLAETRAFGNGVVLLRYEVPTREGRS